MDTKFIAIRIGVVAVFFTLMLIFNTHTYAWHENLGIDANKAAELYQTKPNDPAIVQWKDALQLAINGMDKCLDVKTAISCQHLMSIITSNCNSHPNELLACNDTRIAQYPSILKQAQEAQQKAEEEQKKIQEAKQKAEEAAQQKAEEERKKAVEAGLKTNDAEIQQLKKLYYSEPPSHRGFDNRQVHQCLRFECLL